uniref:CCHC-type domain-containing protein n=1 Tax=Brassica campestris TaxID=3711 RepID=M4E7A2_BRACM
MVVDFAPVVVLRPSVVSSGVSLRLLLTSALVLAKVLVEMELDRDFPKLIALDDKQGNIFLVNVEYTWIPSMCERCGNLGHKAKRCLLPSSTAQVSISASTSQDTSSDVPIVDIDTVMQQKDNVEYSVPTIQKNDLHVSGKTSLQTKDDGAHEPEKHTIEIEGLLSELEATPTLQQENPTASPNFIPTLPTLVDSQPTPTAASIMESSPSTVTNTEVSETLVVGPQATTHTPFAFESPAQFKGSRDVGVDEDGTEPSSSLSLTRGGRETKPPSKYQDMEWKTVRGRGKRGRRGRGSYH